MWEPSVSLTPQQDISTLVKMRRAIRARRPTQAHWQQKAPLILRDTKTLRDAASARWEAVYGLIIDLQRAYNAAQDLLDVTITIRKSFPRAWQPTYLVSFARPGETPSIEIRLAMREDDVVTFTIARRTETEALPRIFEEGSTIGDRKAMQQLFREVVRCCFLKD